MAKKKLTVIVTGLVELSKNDLIGRMLEGDGYISIEAMIEKLRKGELPEDKWEFEFVKTKKEYKGRITKEESEEKNESIDKIKGPING